MYLRVFLEDAQRFILAFRHICDRTPLQVYSSAVIFAPQNSIVRTICGKSPEWLNLKNFGVLMDWDPELQDFEGHTGHELSLDISQDGKLLASAGRDGTIRL